MNIEVGDGRREEDLVNATVGWVSPFRGSRGERGEEEVGKKAKGERRKGRKIMNNEYRIMNIEVGDGRREEDLVNATVGWVSPLGD